MIPCRIPYIINISIYLSLRQTTQNFQRNSTFTKDIYTKLPKREHIIHEERKKTEKLINRMFTNTKQSYREIARIEIFSYFDELHILL